MIAGMDRIRGPGVRMAVLLAAGMLAVVSPAAAQQAVNPVEDFIADRYRKAALSGDAKAQFTLGYLHERGMIGTGAGADSRARAKEWYQMAADNGYAPAQFRLGVMLTEGDQAAQDKALALYGMAAKQGMKEAQFNLALMLDRRGELEKAAQWLVRAAGQGMPQAMRRLGILHMEGRGVPQDLPEAWIWLVKAVGAGDNDAVLLVGEIDARLSDEEREKAKARLEAEQH